MIPDDHAKIREIATGPLRGLVVVNSMIDQFLRDGGNPDQLLRDGATLIKAAGSTRSALVELNNSEVDGKVGRLYVKEFRFKGTIHSLKPLIRQHRAQIMWKVSWHLLNHSIPVPEPEGYLLKQKGPICLRGYFFSKALRRCPSLSELTANLEQLTERLSSGGLNGALAHYVAALHNSGAIHGDLKWANILVHQKENQLWLVDLDASTICRRYLGPKGIARDLARFVLSGLEVGVDGAILAGFLDHYAQRRNLTLKDIEGPVMKVLQKLRKRHERKRQNMVR
jgi:RIO kinase 1